jgi:hypothetical protein
MEVIRKSICGALIFLEVFLVKGLVSSFYDVVSRPVVHACPLSSGEDVMRLYRMVVKRVDVDCRPGSLNSEEWGIIYSTIGKKVPENGRIGYDLRVSDLENYLELSRRD